MSVGRLKDSSRYTARTVCDLVEWCKASFFYFCERPDDRFDDKCGRGHSESDSGGVGWLKFDDDMVESKELVRAFAVDGGDGLHNRR